MSGLAALLARRVPPGVYRWHAAYDVADVRGTVEHAGWRFAHLDGVALEERTAVLRGLGAALDFPDHYGVNLDALADCLADVPGGTVLLWDGWGSLARADERSFVLLVRVLGARAADLRAGELAVLLRGPGPDVGLPDLD